MEEFIRIWCEHWNYSFDEIIQKYNSNIKTNYWVIDDIIDYKIKNNKDIIYKEDIPKIFNLSHEEFMKDIKRYNLDINNLTIWDSYRSCCLFYYYISTFLENEPVDIKIALKD